MNIKNKIWEMNRTQRLIAVITASTILLVVFAHNPFSGYIINNEHTYTIKKPLEKCDDNDKDGYKEYLTWFYTNNSGEQYQQRDKYYIEQAGGLKAYIEQRVSKCHLLKPGLPIDSNYNIEYKTTITLLKFTEWRSEAPIVVWFGYVSHFIYSVTFIASVGAMFIFYVFGVRSNESSQT